MQPFHFKIIMLTVVMSVICANSVNAESFRLQRDGPVARDYIKKLEWMRCSVGQLWEKETCIGEITMLSVQEALEVTARLKNLDGGGWRLPRAKELQSLVTKVENRPQDVKPNIDQETFPNTFAGPYWTSDQSFYSRQYQWSVNFLTGQRFNRFFPKQKLAVRLVRDFDISN